MKEVCQKIEELDGTSKEGHSVSPPAPRVWELWAERFEKAAKKLRKVQKEVDTKQAHVPPNQIQQG